MKRTLLAVVAVAMTSSSFALSYFTGFEPKPDEALGWDAAGLVNSWAVNGFTGTVNNNANGWGFVTNSGSTIAKQSAPAKVGTANVTDYTADATTGLGFSNKKIYVAAKILGDSSASLTTGNRGYGIKSGNSYAVVTKDAGSAVTGYSLVYRNNAFGTTTILNVANPTTTWRHISLATDVSIVGTGKGILKVSYAGVDYLNNFNTSSSDAITAAGMILKHVSGTTSKAAARFDNFEWTDNAAAVPEPSAIVALGFGALCMIRRKK